MDVDGGLCHGFLWMGVTMTRPRRHARGCLSRIHVCGLTWRRCFESRFACLFTHDTSDPTTFGFAGFEAGTSIAFSSRNTLASVAPEMPLKWATLVYWC